MKIVCWNVAGLRGSFKKGATDWLQPGQYDCICFQETKCTQEEADKVMPSWIEDKYPYRYWRSCTGEHQNEGFQKKGLSGTAIWSKQPGIQLPSTDFDKEGRITAVEFGKFILVTVYTPNSQSPESDRFRYRVREWDVNFRQYICSLQQEKKPVIVCGDFNVARFDKDVYKPDEFKNMVAGFMNEERDNLEKLLVEAKMEDAFDKKHPTAEKAFTFWDQKLPYLRRTNRGWRIDYFLTPRKLPFIVRECNHLTSVVGSDHCPIELVGEFLTKRPYKLKLVEAPGN
jgi:exodeoxyribonuclease-3